MQNVTSTDLESIDMTSAAGAGANEPVRQGQRDLTAADYDRMSRSARRVSAERSESFMAAFKAANPGWTPDFSRLG